MKALKKRTKERANELPRGEKTQPGFNGIFRVLKAFFFNRRPMCAVIVFQLAKQGGNEGMSGCGDAAAHYGA